MYIKHIMKGEKKIRIVNELSLCGGDEPSNADMYSYAWNYERNTKNKIKGCRMRNSANYSAF